jgi:hypothetical protein
MKLPALILGFLLTTISCFGQNDHLEPVKYLDRISGVLKEYYGKVFPLLHTGFSEKPYARYTSRPSFSAEYAFSVEEIGGKFYVLSNRLSENYWYVVFQNKQKSVQIKSAKTEINQDLYRDMGVLFQLLAEQAKEKEREIRKGPNGEILVGLGTDGTTYTFSSTDKDGAINSGETWSPHPSSQPLLSRLVKVCDDLSLLGTNDAIFQGEILKSVAALITDLRK